MSNGDRGYAMPGAGPVANLGLKEDRDMFASGQSQKAEVIPAIMVADPCA